MSEATKPTKGEAYNRREGQSTVYVFARIGGGWIQEVAACGPTANGGDEQQANADLITEALNAYDKTGLTPRQLVEQRAELLEVLQGVLGMGRGTSGRIIVEGWQEDVIRAEVAKHVGAKP